MLNKQAEVSKNFVLSFGTNDALPEEDNCRQPRLYLISFECHKWPQTL